ncbi:MAG: thymidylate synthase [Firmicutes bacterium]|nr:thymidylate synthase [Bacillota bacterium]
MSLADEQYLRIAKDILTRGYYDQNRTGVATYKLPHQIMQFDLEQEFPILTTKYVPFKTAVQEMLWIWQQQSSDVTWLHERNIHIWDHWTDENNTIGKGYGYQISKYRQLDKLLDTLVNNPQDRRMIVTLWNIEDLPEMTLPPCAYETLWDVTDGRLNCLLVQRSGDWPLGVPFNTTQYAVLVHLIAQVVGLRVGRFTHVINNAHIYENQVSGITLQLERAGQALPAPKLWINPEVSDFYEFDVSDIQLVDYQHLGKIPMEVSI